MTTNAVLDAIANRRSIRQYQQRAVDRDTILQLLRAGMAAPSAGNRQPWEFVVTTERQTLDRLADVHPFAKMLYQAPLCISVCANLGRTYEGVPDYWIQDCSAATENILLAAEALGLGAVWCGVFPRMDRVEEIRRILSLPSIVVPLNVVAVGYGAEDPPVKDKWREERVHWEVW